MLLQLKQIMAKLPSERSLRRAVAVFLALMRVELNYKLT